MSDRLCPSSGDPVTGDQVDGDLVCWPLCPGCGRTVVAVRSGDRFVIRRHRDRRDLPMTVATRRRLTSAGGES